MSHHQITDSERSEISILIKKKYSHHAIADALGFKQSTISREIRRNSVKGKYDPLKAKHKARLRRRYSKFQSMKIRGNKYLKKYIIKQLKAKWTPEEISGRIRKEDTDYPDISTRAIYKWLETAEGEKYCKYLLRKKPGRKYKPKTKGFKSLIPNRIGIEERPLEANSRKEYGHFETDSIVSGKRHSSKVALSVLHERKSRFTRIRKTPNMKPSVHANALIDMGIDLFRRSVTYDNGIECRDHEKVAELLKVNTYFCNPYSSWEKGGIENTNGRIRRFIPKGADISDYSCKDIAKIEHWLNHTPRKCLDFKTPYEVMLENNLLLSSISPNSQ